MVHSCWVVLGLGQRGGISLAKKASEQGRQVVLDLFNPNFCFSRLKNGCHSFTKEMGRSDHKRNRNELIFF